VCAFVSKTYKKDGKRASERDRGEMEGEHSGVGGPVMGKKSREGAESGGGSIGLTGVQSVPG